MKVTNETSLPIHVEYHEGKIPSQMHHHNYHQIIFVMQGQAKLSISGKEYICRTGTAAFISNFEAHSTEIISEPYIRYILYIRPDFLHSAISDYSLTSFFSNPKSRLSHLLDFSLCANKITHLLKKIMFETDQQLLKWQDVSSIKLYELIIELYRQQPDAFYPVKTGSIAETVSKVQQFIDKNYMYDLKLTDLANEFHIDMCYLSHLFTEILGYNYSTYLTLQRISAAKELLISTQKTITQIATSVGYNTSSRFISTFKEKTGLTPLQYRKQNYIKPEELS